jgi:hypothetical protein
MAMRLTLRNLLAYLHGALSPENHAAMEALIKATPRIQTLIDRCKDLPKYRLAAPAIEQAQPLHQAETVAMYLDFTLPDDQVAPFEKAVLASDELLAEVVTAHRCLTEVLAQRIVATDQVKRERFVALVQTKDAALAEAPQLATASAANTDFVTSASLREAQTDAHDSGDLTGYLSDIDDDEELSLDAAEQRARASEEQAIAAAASAYATGTTATALPRVSVYSSPTEHFRHSEPPPPELFAQEQPLETQPKSKMPLIAGAAGGGVLVLGLVLWVVSSLFSGSTATQPQGPHTYGVDTSLGPTCELHGSVRYQSGGSAPSADVGALIVAWPVTQTIDSVPLSTQTILEKLEEKQQSAYNRNLVVAKTDDDGNYRLRMLENTEFYVMILSQRSTTTNPKTWGEAAEAIAVHVEDPVVLIGQRNYHFQKLTMPGEKQATLDHTFTE